MLNAGTTVAHLKVLTGEDAGKVIPLEGDRVVFGRHPSCAVILEDGAVSRQHAQIVQSHGSYYVKDLRSRNGTQVNEADVTEPTLLKEENFRYALRGDVVALIGTRGDILEINPDGTLLFGELSYPRIGN